MADSRNPNLNEYCIPVSANSKPKQNRKSKLDKLLKKHSVPSTIAASFVQILKRLNAGKIPVGKLETKYFKKFKTLSTAQGELHRCIAESFDNLSSKHKKLFNLNMLKDINSPVEIENTSTEFAREIEQIVLQELEIKEPDLKERPGKVRLIDYADDVSEHQIHIFKIKNIRTNDHIPYLKKRDFLPREFQQTCTPVIDEEAEEVKEWDCEVEAPPCKGHEINGACLRVLQLQSGRSLQLTGVNFFDVKSKIHIRRKGSNSQFKNLKAFVYGDIETPLYERRNGRRVVIKDKRVKDRIFFMIPKRTLPGIYEFRVAVPNSSDLPNLGRILYSNIQYIEVIPPSTARFQIKSERLWARKETWPEWPGSDEVGLIFNAIPVLEDLRIGNMKQEKFRFGDVDSGETRSMDKVLFSHSSPIAAVAVSVIGYEIDGESEYEDQITQWTDVLAEFVRDTIAFVKDSDEIRDVVGEVSELSKEEIIALSVILITTFAIILIIAYWLPADLIIEDYLNYSLADLGERTSINYPKPTADSDETLYTTQGGIAVRLMLTSKNRETPFQYIEERGYLSSEEESWYNIMLKFNRLS